LLKENMLKDLQKDIYSLKMKRKEQDYTIDYSKSPINFDSLTLPKISNKFIQLREVKPSILNRDLSEIMNKI